MSATRKGSKKQPPHGPLELPPPGLDGTWRETCVVCFRGTDTALALTGEAEWLIVALTKLGIPSCEEAAVMVADATGCDLGKVSCGRHTLRYRLCRRCAAASPLPWEVGLIASGEIPHYGSPSETTANHHG